MTNSIALQECNKLINVVAHSVSTFIKDVFLDHPKVLKGLEEPFNNCAENVKNFFAQKINLEQILGCSLESLERDTKKGLKTIKINDFDVNLSLVTEVKDILCELNIKELDVGISAQHFLSNALSSINNTFVKVLNIQSDDVLYNLHIIEQICCIYIHFVSSNEDSLFKAISNSFASYKDILIAAYTANNRRVDLRCGNSGLFSNKDHAPEAFLKGFYDFADFFINFKKGSIKHLMSFKASKYLQDLKILKDIKFTLIDTNFAELENFAKVRRCNLCLLKVAKNPEYWSLADILNNTYNYKNFSRSLINSTYYNSTKRAVAEQSIDLILSIVLSIKGYLNNFFKGSLYE